MPRIVCFCLLLFWMVIAIAQPPVCILPGQTPSTAFRICGNGTLTQNALPVCRNFSLYVTGCTNSNTTYGDNNPIYYRFTCATGGSFAFTITPFLAHEDIDWQLYDITNHSPEDITFDRSLIVTGNWSGSPGPTGAAAGGAGYIQCRSDHFQGARPTFAAMPQLQTGHEYLLMIGHMDDLVTGFTLSIGGGTADITSAAALDIRTEVSDCNQDQLTLLLSQKIRCNSIAANGSDFRILPSPGAFTVTGISCGSQAETDSIVIRLASPLTTGNYTLSIVTGSDGNTLTDACNNAVPANTLIPFSIDPYPSVDSVLTAGCQPSALQIPFTKKINCTTIAGNGSDFSITGPAPVVITSVAFSCTNNTTTGLTLSLQQPVTKPGLYTLTIRNGTDGNTIADDCNHFTPAGVAYTFIILDTVNADFNYTVLPSCTGDSVRFFHDGNNGTNSWFWNFDNVISTVQNPAIRYNSGGFKQVDLLVSNGQCRDSVTVFLPLEPKIEIDITLPAEACPGEPIRIINNSKNVRNWEWDFGNGNSSTAALPGVISYPFTGVDKRYTITATATRNNCVQQLSFPVLIKGNCTPVLPTAFSPNGDGLNDFFGPVNAGASPGLRFRIYNREGLLVFQSTDASVRWDGKRNGKNVPAGIYVWMLQYNDTVTDQLLVSKGTVMLIR